MNRKYGRVLTVNLDDRSSKIMEIEPEILTKFIGGPGLAAWLYGQMVKRDVVPLDPASPFFILTGPMTGTPVPFSGRHLPPFNIMLADYYEFRGWNKEGIPTPETYKRLGI